MRSHLAACAVLASAVVSGCAAEQQADRPAPSSSAAASPASTATALVRATAPTMTGLLDWRPAGSGVEEPVTIGGRWTLSVAPDRRTASLAGPGSSREVRAPGRVVSDALLSSSHAVVVLQDRHESRAAEAVVVELATGRERRLGPASRVPTVSGGTWALGKGRLLHATRGPAGAYCLASVELATGAGEIAWCAPERHGFNGAHLTSAGTSLMTFDDSRPSCRTVSALTGGEPAPIPEATPCRGWDVALLDHGPVWSEVEREDDVESARFFARTEAGVVELGPGTSGTLVPCGGAAYFVRDSQRGREPARLMRWDGRQLAVVYESPAGPAFLETPRCGGDALTVSAFAEGGDEQVTAPLG